MPKVSDEHRRAVRARLVAAAARCVARDGAAAVSTRSIVAEAGLSTGTLYHHFGAVEHLLAAVAEEELRAGVAAAAGAPPAAGEGPLAWTLHRVVGDVALARRLAALRRRVEGRPGAAARLDAMVAATLAEVVRQAQVEGEVAADIDAEALVGVLALVWDGLGRRPHDAVPSPDRVVGLMAALVVEAPPGAGAPRRGQGSPAPDPS